MGLETKSKRHGMDCSIDVFYEETDGFSKHINDKTTYKLVLISAGAFVVEDNGGFRLITAPVCMILNEKAELKIVSEAGVKSKTIYFKPTFIREEFTFDAISSGKYDLLFGSVKDENLSQDDRTHEAINGNREFEKCFKESIYQDYLYLTGFNHPDRDIRYWALLTQEYEVLRRFFISVQYDVEEQPDNFWILRTRYFLLSILVTLTADFYAPYRQYELYEDRFVAKVAMYLFKNISDEITIADLTKHFSVNKNALNEAFYNETSMSCMAYLENMRITLAKRYLQLSNLSVSEIGDRCGYRDHNYFSKVFKKHTGMSATEYQKQMKGLC